MADMGTSHYNAQYDGRIMRRRFSNGQKSGFAIIIIIIIVIIYGHSSKYGPN